MKGNFLFIGKLEVNFIVLISISGVILLVVWVIVKINLVMIVGFVIGSIIC